ncbi:CDGSH iron-sulfur domain-containing protein [Streptomyces sp. NPDC060028]|uniref:CDGSH iron-sulfur domain-containing protein n=1 Tax=Streptomyces sp. NPDC060028 TaxID=3347041 RepID=UPI0036C13347
MPSTSENPAPGRDRAADGPRRPACRMTLDPQGPLLVEGPVEILMEDGSVARSDRFMVAVCTCRRSRIHPWCDTSHRRHERPAPPADRQDRSTR